MKSAQRGANLSIIVPLFNEQESVAWVVGEVRDLYPEAEIIAVDDGSTDATWAALAQLAGVRRLRLAQNRGQSAAMWVGLTRATRDVCITMDGDGQNDPASIADLVAALGTADVACGYRADRRDTWSKKVASRFANAVRRAVLGDGVRDAGCSLKAFPRSCVEQLVPFDGMHRFLPAFFRHAGLRIVEVPVRHRARKFGVSKYDNVGRGRRGLYDLVGMRWLMHRKLQLPEIEVSE
jgi:dolichol-phosphate mannosyltransferase